MNRLRYRAHSWLADNFVSVQYPREQAVTTIGWGWKHPMPFGSRVLLLIAGGILAAVGIGGLVVLGVLLWSLAR